jgi:integrase
MHENYGSGVVMVLSVVTGKVFSDNTGAAVQIPVLLTEAGPIKPLIDYCLSVSRSLAWQEKLVRAVKLFCEYFEANSSAVATEEEWRVFRNFSNALRSGTINTETREDPSNLWWLPMAPRETNFMIKQISDFFDWLDPKDAPPAAKFNPKYAGNAYDRRLDLAAYTFRRNKALLGHGWSTKPQKNSRLTRGERVPKVLPRRPPSFPEDRFEELLVKGFRVAGRPDYRGMLISLLMFGGGVRVSEPFHLFIEDVHPHWNDPTSAFVAIHHPSLGYAPDHWKNPQGRHGKRGEYLALKYGLTPRHKVRGKLKAGWKHNALDEEWFMQVHWFPEKYGVWFMQIWQLYMGQIANIERHHPFAWVNVNRSNAGGIYTISQYEKALSNAVERIGLVHGKVYGTTPHGGRHAYGQRARKGGIDGIILQRLMHHCSPDSQIVYTQAEVSEIQVSLQRGVEELRKKNLLGETRPLLLPSRLNT